MFTQLRLAACRTITAGDVLDMAVGRGAHATGLEHRIGSLTPGKAADLILLRTDDINLCPVTDPTAAVVTAAHPGNVDTVLVAGHNVKRGGRLTAGLSSVRLLAEAAHAHLFNPSMSD